MIVNPRLWAESSGGQTINSGDRCAVVDTPQGDEGKNYEV